MLVFLSEADILNILCDSQFVVFVLDEPYVSHWGCEFGNFRKFLITYVNQMFSSPALQSDAVLDKQLSRSLCVMFR